MTDILLIIGYSLASLTWWIAIPVRAVLNSRKLRMLSEYPLETPANWPKVSVLIPARNEEGTLVDAVRSLRQVDYPDVEFILINDRSTDNTGDVIDRLADTDVRIKALHIERLPEGWLGKVHALHRGIEISNGEWLLFTDADIHFSSQALKKAVAWCLQRDKDFLALFPDFLNVRLLIGSAQAAFGIMLLSLLDFEKISDPESKMAMGVGAFNLVRKDYLETQNGLEWLRMEIADDAGLGLMVKQRGARTDILSGADLIKVDWYPSLAAMMDGVMQRFVMGAHYSLSLYLLHCAFACFCLIAPLGLSIALAQLSTFGWLCLLVYIFPSIILETGIKNVTVPRVSKWGLPIGYAVICYGMLRSMVSYIRNGGVYWRGNVYPLKKLRKMQRVKMSNYF